MSDVIVRFATRADRAALLAFHRALYIDHRDEITPPELLDFYAYRDFDRVLRDDVDGLLASATTLVLVAEAGGEPVGYATGHIEDEPRRVLPRKGVVEDWYVVPGARGRGVGKLLMERLLSIFRDAGCHVAESTTWAHNTGARRAHDGLGFTEIEVKYRKRL